MSTAVVHEQPLWEAARRVLVGGVNSPVRSFAGIGQDPVMAQRGEGAYIWDVDDQRYIDLIGSWGPLVLGHAHPQVVQATVAALQCGTSFGLLHEGEVALARSILEAFPAAERVRLMSSGTEAAMTALRVARGVTGRSLIVKCAGCYHGHSDGVLVRAGSSAAELGVPDSAGIPEVIAQQTTVVPYNDVEALNSLFTQYGDDIAAVILEPVAANMGLVLPQEGYLKAARQLTARAGACLIFDEVVTGFRLSYGGEHDRTGVQPDLTVLGKIIGGGLPMGAVVGAASWMDALAPVGNVYQAGTLSGNPISVAAGLATLKLLQEPNVYNDLAVAGAQLGTALRSAADTAGVPVVVHQMGSMVGVFFAERSPIHCLSDVELSSRSRYATYARELRARGVLVAPSAMETHFLSVAHTEGIVHEIETALPAVMALVAATEP